MRTFEITQKHLFLIKHNLKCCLPCVVRSASDELHNDTSSLSLKGDEVVECASVPTCSDLGPETLKEGSANHEEHLVEGPVSEDFEKQVTNCHYCRGHGGDKEMKRALEHQAELIVRYEAEERAQRDWEEKFRENNSRTPVCLTAFNSYGNHFIFFILS